MKHVMAAVAFFIVASAGALAEPVLMLNEPRDVTMAKYRCDWAANEIKSYNTESLKL